MKTLVRLIVASICMSGVAGSSLVAYFVGYTEGLGVSSKSVQAPVTSTEVEPVPAPVLRSTEMSSTIDG